MTILDWILGRDRERARQEPEKAEATRHPPQEPVEQHVQMPPRVPPGQSEATLKPEKRPAMGMMPHEADRIRHAHDRQPEPESDPERTQEATRMANTLTPQPGPSLGGPGVNFVNPRAQPPRQSVAAEMLAEARAELAKEEALKTREQKLNEELQRLERPDYGLERAQWNNDQTRQ